MGNVITTFLNDKYEINFRGRVKNPRGWKFRN